ncbi:MAG: poly(3-hydroxyalkanoate) depolymerase, partial [Chloroflexi bacterium]|nr:poly(3-hydroxyalkanoate) depolymerase [Chloroflexota bacterium]
MEDGSVGKPAGELRVEDIEVDGQRLHVAVQGSTSRELPYPLLLLNGIGANLELLQPFVDALGGGIETIRFDVPGTGHSPAPDRPYRIRGLAGLTAHLLDQMGYGDADVLGIS